MTLFRYEATDKAGKVVHGAMKAANEQAVAQRLSSIGYSLRSIVPAHGQPQPKTAATPRTARAASSGGQFPVSVEPSVSLSALQRFYRQLATMVRSGMPVGQALDELEGATPNRKLRRACGDMKARVQAGESLSSAMAAYPHLFPVHSVGMIWGGEAGGYLDAALDEAATEIEQEAKDRRYASIGWWVARLSIANFILLIPAIDLQGLVVRGLTEAAKLAANASQDFTNTDLIPSGLTPQQAVEGMLRGYWGAFKEVCIPIFVIWIVGAFVWKRLKRVGTIRRLLDAGLLLVPAWRKIHGERARERFLKTLFRQYQAGVAPAQAWAAASMSVRNSELARRLRGNGELMRQPGGTLQQAFVQSGVFAMDDVGMVGSGEKSGSVPETLERLAAYHGDAASSAKTIGRAVSLHALLLPIIIATGYVLIKVVQGYFDLVFSAPKMLGLE